MSREDALQLLLDAASPTEATERLPLVEARGRVAAEDVRAPFHVPPFDRAMMDGFAVRGADVVAPGARLRVVGAAHAGHPFGGRLGAGEAVRIATGAPVPAGADTVVRVEDTAEDARGVVIAVAVTTGRSVDPSGSDMKQGQVVVTAGERLTPARLGLIASLGQDAASVWAQPRVRVHASGDELLRPGDAPVAGRIYDSNSTTLAALFEDVGASVVRGAPLPDEMDALRAVLREAAADADVVVISGGASVGERDLTVDALRAEGKVLFHGVRVKPGKPLLAGRVGKTLVVGLPGNPTSALSNAALFIVPALQRIARITPTQPMVRRARLTMPVSGEADRFLFLPVRFEPDGMVSPTFKGSGALTSLSASDGWVGVPEGASFARGDDVEVHPW